MALLGDAIGFGINKLFGPGDDDIQALRNPVGANFNAGGLRQVQRNGQTTVTADQNRQGLVGGQADFVGNLRGLVRPGFGALTTARVRSIQDAGMRAVGNLRQNLARRGVAGSSFAGDSLARVELETGKQVGEARATSFLEELQLTNTLGKQEFDTRINELNLQASIAQGASQAFAAASNQNARILADLNRQAIEGFAKFTTDIGSSVEGGLRAGLGGFG